MVGDVDGYPERAVVSGLQERIAAALFAAVGPPGIAWDEVSQGSRDAFLGMAESVVAALNLTEERDMLDWDAAGDPGVGGKQIFTRFVTPWLEEPS